MTLSRAAHHDDRLYGIWSRLKCWFSHRYDWETVTITYGGGTESIRFVRCYHCDIIWGRG